MSTNFRSQPGTTTADTAVGQITRGGGIRLDRGRTGREDVKITEAANSIIFRRKYSEKPALAAEKKPARD